MADDTAFPRDEELTAIAIAYKNPDTVLVQDEIFPKTPVGRREFKYFEYDLARGFSVPDTRVGEHSKVPQIKLTGTEIAAKVVDQGLEIPLTHSDINDAPKTINPRGHATEQATNLVMLDREIRCASLAFNPASYPAGFKVDVSTDLGGGAGAEQFTQPGADPLTLLQERLDQCWIRPNHILFGQPAWNAFAKHPKIVSAAIGNDGTQGRATRQRVAELLEVQRVLVGTGFVNSVKPGKTPVLTRIWGNHVLGFFRDRTVGVTGGITFGLTAQHGTRVAGSKNIDIGLHGGVAVRAGESVKEFIVASRAAYFFENVV